MTKVAIYPGSFDPPTLAHQEILRQAREVFDQVVVVIGRNGSKRGAYTSDRRGAMWRLVGVNPQDLIVGDPGECVLDWAHQVGAPFVVRGIRDASDVPSEQAYRKFVRGYSQGHIEVVYFMPPPELQHVSSTAVREILQLRDSNATGGWLDKRIADDMLARGELDR